MRLLDAVVAWCLENRPLVIAATLLLCLLGVQAAITLPIDAVPDVTNVQVQVITASPALAPVEVEQYVTVPVERAMAGLPRVAEIRSLSKYGLSVVTIVFWDDTDIYLARQLVSERMREAEDAIPAQYGRPTMGPITSGLGEIFQFTVRGEGHSLMELEETLDFYIGPQLRLVPGVVEVNSFGGQNKEYQVVLDPSRLQAAGLSVEEVVRALERTNANAGGGYIERHREQLVIGSLGQVKSLEDLRTVVVGATREGVPITIANVGEVRFGPKIRRGAATMDGQGEVVVGVALMLLGENSRTVTEAVKAKIAALQPTLPRGMRIEPFYDRAVLVDRTIGTVAKNLAEGAALVILVLFVLLGDLRAGLIVAATIPLAMLLAILLMRATGTSGNLMSLGAIDFGLIVDGAVIIVENAVRRLGAARRERGRPLLPAERVALVREAAVEVRSASIFGELIIAIVYLPILALRGIEGRLFHPMAKTVLFALLGALVLSLTVIPVLASYFLHPSEGAHETWLMRRLERLYRPLVGGVLGWRALTLALGCVVLGAGALVATRLGAEFVPQLDEGDLLIEARRLPGIALSETVATDLRLQRAIRQIPEIQHVVSRIGSPEVATDPMGIEQSDVFLLLAPRSAWRDGMTKARLGEAIAQALGEAVPEVAGALSQPIQMRTNELIAGVRSDVAAQIYGADLAELQRLGERVARVLERIPGAVDVRAAQGAGLGYLRIHPDRARLARYGLTVEDVNRLTETIAVGHPVGTVFEGDRRFGLVVKMGPMAEKDPAEEGEASGGLDALRALPLKSNTGQVVPLGDVAEVRIEQGPALVNREQLSRRLTVEFNVRGRDLVSVVEAAQATVAREVTLPPGYRIEWGGEFQNYLSARHRLAIVVPLALLLIVFLLWLAFRELKAALLILLSVPFAVVGGVVALWLRGIPFSISAGVGFVALFGVAVLNGLVLVSFSRQREAQGMAPGEAIAQAAQMRLRPVLMTALVAAFGFVPMALSTAPGSEVQRPLATVVIGGLCTATALTLLLLPAVYALVHRRSKTPA
ncbi:MAG TPA: CusA/CzcA family heavy metal efflux RND transporter [Polyangia bacterium]|nr:CusA/CzcA family heavy metal efflux RND transporter [Polyangia bacterium]